jgi:hypothetical protein
LNPALAAEVVLYGKKRLFPQPLREGAITKFLNDAFTLDVENALFQQTVTMGLRFSPLRARNLTTNVASISEVFRSNATKSGLTSVARSKSQEQNPNPDRNNHRLKQLSQSGGECERQ